MKKAFLILTITSFFLLGCQRMNNDKIMKSWWKFGSGYHIGDALRFDKNNLNGDTIYRNGQADAIITYCGKPVFWNSAILEIESLDTRESGTYHEKGHR